MKFFTFTYGTGVLYGPSAALDFIYPETGPSTGGQDFIIGGNNFNFTTFDDEFTGGTLDLVKWTDISSGTGSVSTGATHLLLNSGSTAGSVGGIEMNLALTNTQFESKIQVPSVSVLPAIVVNLYTMQLYIDASNYVNLEINKYANGDLKAEVGVYSAGSLRDSYSEDWTTGVSTFKILRWSNVVYIYANGSLMYTSNQFVSTAAKFRFFCTNLADTYDIQDIVVSSVNNRTFAVFGNQPVHDTITIGNIRLRGLTPASVDSRGTDGAYKGLVDVSVVTEATVTSSNFYEYYYLDNLTLIDNSQYGVKLSKIGDDSVRTPQSENIGLGGGK